MATNAYRTWVRAGRPWKKAAPVADMESYARRHGIRVLGTIGNEDHLTSNTPEDHTPYSYTAWPRSLPGYVVTAIDLADSKGIGAAILRDARAGRCKWLKYMNRAGRHYSHSDGFKTGRPNPDTHVHLSVRTDHLNTRLTDYDPLGDDMPTVKEIWTTDGIIDAPSDAPDKKENPHWTPENVIQATLNRVYKLPDALARIEAEQKASKTREAAIMAKLNGATADEVRAIIRAELTGLAESLAIPLGNAVAARLGDLAPDAIGAAVAEELARLLAEAATP